MSVFHVVPESGILPHNTEAGGMCWCDPEVKVYERGSVVIHAEHDDRLNRVSGDDAPEDGGEDEEE